MSRIISFLSAKGGIGKSSIIYNLSKNLSFSDYKVCVIDSYFALNGVSLLLERNKSIDFKEYILGNLGTFNVLNKVNNNLFYVNTNSSNFDYKKHLNLIKFFILEIAENFDFIFIDVNCFDECVMEVMLEVSNEVIFITSDNEISIRNTAKIINYAKRFKNVYSRKILLNMTREIASIKNKIFCLKDIEDLLKTEVLFSIPKYYKNEIFGGRSFLKYKSKLMKQLSYAIITNKPTGKLKNRYKGVLGLIRKWRYAKYE